MQNTKLKKDCQSTLKAAFSIIENNETLIKFLELVYKSCNYNNLSNDPSSLIFMEGRRSLYQNLFKTFMSRKLREKVECGD